MPIKEEPVVVSFTYEIDERVDVPYKFKYESLSGIPMLYIAMMDGSEATMQIHAEVIADVIDNLRAKGLMKKNGTNPVPQQPTTLARTSVLQSPSIVKRENSSVLNIPTAQTASPAAPSAPFIESEPFTSFSPSAVIEDAVETTKTSESVAEPIVAQKSTAGIIRRPVIRSRVTNDDDPLSAEREASMLRGAGASEKAIRRKDE